jgi:hypothetical protein
VRGRRPGHGDGPGAPQLRVALRRSELTSPDKHGGAGFGRPRFALPRPDSHHSHRAVDTRRSSAHREQAKTRRKVCLSRTVDTRNHSPSGEQLDTRQFSARRNSQISHSFRFRRSVNIPTALRVERTVGSSMHSPRSEQPTHPPNQLPANSQHAHKLHLPRTAATPTNQIPAKQSARVVAPPPANSGRMQTSRSQRTFTVRAFRFQRTVDTPKNSASGEPPIRDTATQRCPDFAWAVPAASVTRARVTRPRRRFGGHITTVACVPTVRFALTTLSACRRPSEIDRRDCSRQAKSPRVSSFRRDSSDAGKIPARSGKIRQDQARSRRGPAAPRRADADMSI